MKHSVLTLGLAAFFTGQAFAGTLNCDLRSDSADVSMPSVSKPGYLQSYTDPVFGTKITRITGNPGTAIASGGTWGTDVHHQYSKIQAFNADQSLLFIETNRDGGGTGGVFLDGNTYQPLISANCPGSECLWHPTDPNKMIYVTSNSVGSWNPRTGSKSVIATFSGYSGLLFGQYEGNLTLNGNMVALDGYNSGGKLIAFAYDLVNKVKYPDVDFNKWGNDPGSTAISPNGNYLVTGYEDENSATVVTDLNGNFIKRFPLAVPDHYDLTVDASGDEVAVGSARDEAHYGQVVKVRLRDAAITPLSLPGGYASHTSTRGTALRTWGVSNIFSDSERYKNEIVTYDLDGSKVYRLAHDHNPNPDYEAETHPMQSPDGLRVVFASSWSSNVRPVSVYVIDLRPNCGAVTPPPPPPPPPPPSGNLLNNPGFESRLSGWTKWAHAGAVTNKVFEGTYSLKVTGSDGVYQDVTAKISAGRSYTLSFAARVSVAGDTTSEIGIEFFDAAGNVIYDKHLTPSSTAWKRMSFGFTAPSGAVSALVYVYKSSSSANLFADAMSLASP